MRRYLDLVVHIGEDSYSFGLCLRFDWLAQRTVAVSDATSLHQEISSFLEKAQPLFDSIGKIVIISDIAHRFEALVEQNPRFIGYIRIAQDQYEPEYMRELLTSSGGALLTEYMRPGEPITDSRIQKMIERFMTAGISDIAILSAYQLGITDIPQLLKEHCERLFPGYFSYHNLDSSEYESFLLSENRLLAGLCIKKALKDEVDTIISACKSHDLDAPIFIMSGEGVCVDQTTALKDPVITWKSRYAAVLTGSARLFGLSDAIAVSPTAEGIMIDRIKEYRPVPMGRTKRYFSLQVSGPMTGAVEFRGVPHRQRLLEAINRVNTEPGPLPIIDLTDGLLDGLEIEESVYRLKSYQSALLTGAQCALFRKDFYGAAPVKNPMRQLKSSLYEESIRWLASSGITVNGRRDEYLEIKLRYLNADYHKVRLRVRGRIN